MIRAFGHETALLVIDAQQGVNNHQHWGGSAGHRNNPAAETRIAELLQAWRARQMPVYFTMHDSREAASPLKLSLASGQPMTGLEPLFGERVVVKDVNSGFTGTNLELFLRRDGISRLLVAGFFTNMCIESTIRAAGNMGYDSYLAHDACAAGNRLAPDGRCFDAELVHAMSVANLHREFCTALTTAQAIGLLSGPNEVLHRMQGNELHRGDVGMAEAA